MRRIVATVVALGALALTVTLTVTLALPAQARTITSHSAAIPVGGATLAHVRPAADTVKPDRIKRVCKDSVAVKRNGHVIGRLHQGDEFKVIRPVYHDEWGFEIVGYYGIAFGAVNARGTVRAGAFCH